MRGALLLVAVAVSLAAAAPAPAAVTPLRSVDADDEQLAYALSGDEALLSQAASRRAQVLALPAAGGGAAATRLDLTAPYGADISTVVEASDRAAAAVVATDDPVATQRFAGAAGLPLATLGPLRRLRGGRAWFPFLPVVAADRVFFAEIRGDFRAFRIAVHEPRPGEPAAITLPAMAVVAHEIAGDAVAFTARRRGDSGGEPRQLVVRDWRTGAERWVRRIPRGIESLDLHDDGRVLVGTDGGGVLEVAAGGAGVRRVSRDGTYPAYAGDAAVFLRDRSEDERPSTLVVATPDGAVRPFGVPANAIDPPVADARRVLWRANGCLLSAPVDAPAQAAIDEGPCPRTEMAFRAEASQRLLRRDRRVRLVLGCVAAPPPGCAGTAELRGEDRHRVTTPRRFLIPVGAEQAVTVRLTRRAHARGRREARQGIGGTEIYEVRAVSTDPAGRRSVAGEGLVLELPSRK